MDEQNLHEAGKRKSSVEQEFVGQGSSKRPKGKPGEQVFRCAACRVDCPDELSFRQHINGKPHAKKSRNKIFAGIYLWDMPLLASRTRHI